MSLFTIIAKDLRLLWRDKAGLIFLTIAPILVITVAGFSLANLYGADPTGQTAYELPLVDEDGGAVAQRIRARLQEERSVRVQPVTSREEARHLVDSKVAGAALVIPRGLQSALEGGKPATLIVYTDPVKYLERLNVRTRVLELTDALAAEQRQEMRQRAADEHDRLRHEVERLRDAVAAARAHIDAVWQEAVRERRDAGASFRTAVARAQGEAETQLQRELQRRVEDVSHSIDTQIAAFREPVRAYLDAIAAARQAFAGWLAELQRRAGSHARDIPPPPGFPELPPQLEELVSDRPLVHIPPVAALPAAPPLRLPEPPAAPSPPQINVPEITVPESPAIPGAVTIEEVTVGGGPKTINTFDQNVPGFSVTFLLLGMLLGVSLGLLDERDWGTFDRLRAMPIPTAQILMGKLLSRFLVGVVQMIALFAVGRVAFAISLGSEPWALLLPTAGIVFAGTAFGLIVAAVASSREAVLPVGSIVIVTMAAVGGCWGPIDLEPRWMRTVALALPTTWAMDAFNDLMIRRRPLASALVPTAMMVAYGLAYLVVGLALFRRQLRRD